MYTIHYFNNENLIGQKSFKTFKEAENNYHKSNCYSKCDYFEVSDNQTKEVVMEFVVPQKTEMMRGFFFNEEDDQEDYGFQLGV